MANKLYQNSIEDKLYKRVLELKQIKYPNSKIEEDDLTKSDQIKSLVEIFVEEFNSLIEIVNYLDGQVDYLRDKLEIG